MGRRQEKELGMDMTAADLTRVSIREITWSSGGGHRKSEAKEVGEGLDTGWDDVWG
jgi:hypothetical protein